MNDKVQAEIERRRRAMHTERIALLALGVSLVALATTLLILFWKLGVL